MKKITFYQNGVEIILRQNDIDKFVGLGLLNKVK